MSKSSKGSSYEREVCRLLSLWWTNHERDDIFWRTSNSGGRATVREKSKRRTFGQYGDVQATDPIGAPLMRIFCWELKRGYSRQSFADVLDGQLLRAPTMWEQFVNQARRAAELSNSAYWLLVQRRDQKQAFIFFPRLLLLKLEEECGVTLTEWGPPFVLMRVVIRTENGPIRTSVCGTTLSNFLKTVTPSMVKALDKARS